MAERPVPLEQEIKARLADPRAFRGRLAAAGATLEHPRALEVNDLWDTPDRALRAAWRILRVRRYGEAAIVTYKGPGRIDNGVRSRPEIETTVGDAGAIEAILSALGLVRTFRYEKYREVWRRGDLEIVIDETPLGFFVEIEGSESAVRSAADELGIPPADVVGVSYARLWELHREANPAASPDMLFAPDGNPRS